MNHFLIGLWKVHFIPSEDTQLSHWTRRSSKAIPKASFAHKKGHGHCSVICCPSDALQLSASQRKITSEKYIQQIDEMH